MTEEQERPGPGRVASTSVLKPVFRKAVGVGMHGKSRVETLRHVQKRDGSIAPFEPQRIVQAIYKASVATDHADHAFAANQAEYVVRALGQRFAHQVPTVEQIQDVVEGVLAHSGRPDVTRAFMQYRIHRSQVRESKQLLGVKDDLKLDVNALAVMRRRYLQKDEQGQTVETPAQCFRRVARVIAAVDKEHGAEKSEVAATEESFYSAMANGEFLPNSPTLMNAGTKLGILSACFVYPVEDSLEGIFDAVKWQALTQQQGGGTGFSFSRLRPRGDVVGTTKGVASGPLSFMSIFDRSTDVIKQGGRRRGANMAILRVDHPDILEFITAKQDPSVLANFNISVAVTDKFMRAVEKDQSYDLIDPKSGKSVKSLRAKAVFDMMVYNAWRTGDPGLVFIDEINRRQPTPELGEIEATNPCAEVPLQPFDSCNLGSINVAKFVDAAKGVVEWDRVKRAVWLGVHFLDNVIDANRYILPQTEHITKANRKIGLGVMGFAEYLIRLDIPYSSPRALKAAQELMGFVQREGQAASQELGAHRGSFPAFKGSRLAQQGHKMRNATVTTIAPTGTISIVAGCSSGIEPLFAVSFVRDVLEGTRLLEVNREFERMAKARGFYSKDLMHQIARTGSVQGLTEVPADVQELFKTAHEIPVDQHVRMQAAFQKHVDNGTSKTINLPAEAPVEDVRLAFELAYKLKCKGITVYRYGSKPEQVLYLGAGQHVQAHSEYAGECPGGVCPTGS